MAACGECSMQQWKEQKESRAKACLCLCCFIALIIIISRPTAILAPTLNRRLSLGLSPGLSSHRHPALTGLDSPFAPTWPITTTTRQQSRPLTPLLLYSPCAFQCSSSQMLHNIIDLRADIKAWERDFKALHGRQPSIDEIRQQPRIGTCSPLSFSISFPSLTTHNAQPKSTNSTRNFPNLPLLLLVLPPPPHPSLPSTLPLLLPLLQNPNHVQALPHYCTNPVQSRPNPHLHHLIPSLP